MRNFNSAEALNFNSAELSTDVVLSIRENVMPFFYQWIPSKQTSSPPSFCSTILLLFNLTPTFLWVTFDHTLSFSKYVSSLKFKFFPHLKAFRDIFDSSQDLSKEFLTLLYKAFLRPLFTPALPGRFSFLTVTNITKLKRLHPSG